jgi:hypothetical protein
VNSAVGGCAIDEVFRRFLSIGAAAALTLGFFVVTASASGGAKPAISVGRSHTEHARFERVSSFRTSQAVGSGPSRYFSADAFLQTDIPKDRIGVSASGTVPKVTATKASGPSAAMSAFGLNAADLSRSHGFVVEPPDQGLCAGNGSVVEMVNNNIQVYSQSTFSKVGPLVDLETFFGQPFDFGVIPGTDFTIQGDPKCYFDAATQRWFLTQLDIDFTNNTSRIFIAVSLSSDPTGSYNIYSAPTRTRSSSPPMSSRFSNPTSTALSSMPSTRARSWPPLRPLTFPSTRLA